LAVGVGGAEEADADGGLGGEGEEEGAAGEHGYYDIADCSLPPGGVVRRGAISWVMFSVFCWFCLGLCWVYAGFSGPSPESDVLCFQSLLGYIHRMELFGPFSAPWRAFATWGGGRFWRAGARGSRQKGSFCWMQNKPSLFHYTNLSRNGGGVLAVCD
jgi:hypothetical protein